MQAIQKQTNNDSIHAAPETTQSRWQNQTAQTANNSMGAVVRRAFIAGANDSPRLVAQRQYIEGLTGSSQKKQAERTQPTSPVNQQRAVQRSEKLADEEEKTLQQKFAFEPPVQLKKAAPSKPNNAGLSDSFKSGIESLSGMSTDHVKLHYNSSQPAQGLLQRKCACGNHTVVGEECAECAKKKSSLQRKLTIGASNDPLEQEADQVAEQVMALPLNSAINVTPPRIQRFSGQASDAANTAPASVDHVLTGSGRPIEPTLRHDMEQRFGHDFSQVRVHTGGTAEQSARDVNTQAYTAGHNIIFGAGRFAPESQEGRRLIAHELTHVVQQSRSDENHAAKHGLKRDPSPIFRATAPTLQRQQAPSAGPVTGVRISSEDGRIVFDTAGGSYSYRLTSCNIPVGDYTVGVTTSGATVHFNFGQAAARSQQFRFGFRIDPGQANPVTLFENQNQVAVSIVEHLPSPQVAPHSSGSAPLASRLVAFQRLVKDAGKLRLAENARALEQWRLFLQQLTPAQVQTQVHAEEARALLESASRRGLAETSLAEQWLQTSGPNRRWVQQQQIEGRYRACTGCHASVQADTMDRRLAEQGPQLRTPIEQLAVGSYQGPRPTFAQGEQITATGQPGLFPVVAQAQERINILQPYLRTLGPDGYRVLPAETLGNTSPPSELVSDIGRRITQRQADYREFSRRIDAADFDYLQLRPIVRDLLPLADADVRQAVLQAIDSAQTWETIESISIGVTSIGLLLLMIFPPTSAIGIGGALALGTAASAHATYRGFQNFEQGRLYSLGRGADSVLDPAQQEAADSLMAIGALNMVLGTVGVASGALGSVRLIRSIPPPGGSLGVVESVEGTAGGNLYRVTGWGTRDPRVVVTGPNGQVIREGMLSSFRPSTPAGARASTTGSSGMAGGYVYPTEGGAARVALPAPLQEPVPAPIPQPVAAPPARANVPVAPNVRAPLATMAVASAADVMASMAAPDRQPVMPSGLSRADQELWRTCNQQHNTYKATQEEASAYAARMDPIAVRLHSNRASAQDRLDFCSMLDERIRLVQRLHRERLRYITLDCDRFDWFSTGTTAAERLAQHQIELSNVDAQLRNFYELRTRFCP